MQSFDPIRAGRRRIRTLRVIFWLMFLAFAPALTLTSFVVPDAWLLPIVIGYQLGWLIAFLLWRVSECPRCGEGYYHRSLRGWWSSQGPGCANCGLMLQDDGGSQGSRPRAV
jgi:hypothetical protein